MFDKKTQEMVAQWAEQITASGGQETKVAAQSCMAHIVSAFVCVAFGDGGGVVVCWLLNVPATCECISGTDLLRQFYMLPH